METSLWLASSTRWERMKDAEDTPRSVLKSDNKKQTSSDDTNKYRLFELIERVAAVPLVIRIDRLLLLFSPCKSDRSIGRTNEYSLSIYIPSQLWNKVKYQRSTKSTCYLWSLFSFLLEIDVWLLMGSSSPRLGFLVFPVTSIELNESNKKKTKQLNTPPVGWEFLSIFEIVCGLLVVADWMEFLTDSRRCFMSSLMSVERNK